MMAKTATSAHAGHRVHFFLRDLTERLAVAPHRRTEDHEILHRAAEHDADDEPDRPGQETELRRERRADQRAGARDRREVVAEDNPLVGRDEVAAVVQALGRRRPARIELEDLLGDEPRVEAVRDEIRAHGRDDEPGGADRFAAREGDVAEGAAPRTAMPTQIAALRIRFMPSAPFWRSRYTRAPLRRSHFVRSRVSGQSWTSSSPSPGTVKPMLGHMARKLATAVRLIAGGQVDVLRYDLWNKWNGVDFEYSLG